MIISTGDGSRMPFPIFSLIPVLLLCQISKQYEFSWSGFREACENTDVVFSAVADAEERFGDHVI